MPALKVNIIIVHLKWAGINCIILTWWRIYIDESQDDIYKHLNNKKYFFIMIYFGKRWGHFGKMWWWGLTCCPDDLV
jgi:hypothetical protein